MPSVHTLSEAMNIKYFVSTLLILCAVIISHEDTVFKQFLAGFRCNPWAQYTPAPLASAPL